jgi:hypothetical protein
MSVVHTGWPVTMGMRPHGGPATFISHSIAGIAEATVWADKALSDAEFTALYNGGSGLDPSADSGDYASSSSVALDWGMGDVSGDTTEAANGIQSWSTGQTGTAVNMTDADNIKAI